MAVKLHLMPIEPSRVKEIMMLHPDMIVQFDDYTQCLITPSKAHGQKRLYPFAKDIIGQWNWVVLRDDLIIVANRLVFQVVAEEHIMPGVSTLFGEYRGMVS